MQIFFESSQACSSAGSNNLCQITSRLEDTYEALFLSISDVCQHKLVEALHKTPTIQYVYQDKDGHATIQFSKQWLLQAFPLFDNIRLGLEWVVVYV